MKLNAIDGRTLMNYKAFPDPSLVMMARKRILEILENAVPPPTQAVLLTADLDLGKAYRKCEDLDPNFARKNLKRAREGFMNLARPGDRPEDKSNIERRHSTLLGD